jgi:hypothetical protein
VTPVAKEVTQANVARQRPAVRHRVEPLALIARIAGKEGN